MIDEFELADRKEECAKIINQVVQNWYFKDRIEYHNGPIYRLLDPETPLGGFVYWTEGNYREIQKVIFNISDDNFIEFLFHELFHCAWGVRLTSREKGILAENCKLHNEAPDEVLKIAINNSEELAAYCFGFWASTKWNGNHNHNELARQNCESSIIFNRIYNGEIMSRGEPYGLSEKILAVGLLALLALYTSSYMF